ncbi:SGNH hydrolase domain-containing protein [Nocardioides psychrotolerans]|uniref:SGNH hydrolase domain-containing protein n=1 Tax=Nocardioides psychrotolerans TaxID=1005945 RepID=UPI00313808EF
MTRLIRALLVLAVALVGLTVTGPSSASASPERAKNPRTDYPSMPSKCVARKDLIPQTPTRCEMNDYDGSRPTLVLWGDSHAWEMIPAIRAALGDRDINFVAYVLGGCAPLDANIDTRAKRAKASDCDLNNDMALRFVQEQQQVAPVKVILGGAWHYYLEEIRKGSKPDDSYRARIANDVKTDTPRLFRTLGEARVDVDVVGQTLTVPEKATCQQGRNPFVCSLPRSRAVPKAAANKKYLRNVMKPLAGSPRYIEVNDALCSKKTCRGKIDGIFTFYDDFHISATRSGTLGRFFAPSVRDITPAATPVDGGDGGCVLLIFC